MKMKVRKCKYCGAPIPEKDQDSKGRKHTKTTDFCRGTNHYRLWWNKTNKKYKQEQDRIRYLKIKTEEKKEPSL